MTPWMRTLHKWLGLVIGLQLILWMTSGMMMSLLDQDRVEGQQFRAAQRAPSPWPTDVLAPDRVVANVPGSRTVASAWLQERPVYQVATTTERRLFDARTGESIVVDAAIASMLARASYTGPGAPEAPQLLQRSTEARDHAGRLWRVDFNDGEGTSVYLSAETGEVITHRNRTWRLFDLFWMLHIMDYAERTNFNNPLVIGAGIGGLFIALTGVWLLFASFRLQDFVPRRWRVKHELAVFSGDGSLLRGVAASQGETVYLALARNGLNLPSNCGGGQSCGLCEVRIRGTAPAATAADRAHLTDAKLKLGYRLACNVPVTEDLQVEAVAGANLWTERSGTVERVTAVTPFLREIVLTPDEPIGQDFQPGSYLQIHVPEYSLPHDRLVRPEEHRAEWSALVLPGTLQNREAVRRSYSLAAPTEGEGGRLTLLARFNPGQQAKRTHPPGRGSTYLYTLQAGDRLSFSGPFGDFAIRPGGREKVFIGGGAGMAPLRAMILSLLDSGATERMHFWYGARNPRDAPYVGEMAELAKRNSNFSWHLVLSEAAECDDALLRGLVHEVAHDKLLQHHPSLETCDFYLCGPPAMLAATRRLLAQLGIPDEHIRFDDFKI
ncbi:PepSY domain-containing protein [Lysobacter soli]|uniref:2Fe-2S iron-sulfur cluster binding domain-containing protein n=1 Tax=Lysobacter soli TaxID=453783 RepID=UPI00209CDD78|nr:2Fe-2S iron-sulfur cluster binding domain-containing protein [Lysobacter soli]UTA55613.1 PepSY domain-containing protein [Lysobacter soli]